MQPPNRYRRRKSSVTTSNNTIIFGGPFDGESLRHGAAAMHRLGKQGYDAINFDFSTTTSAFARDVLPFAALCRAAYHRGTRTLLELPTEHKLAKLFENCNWAHLIDPRQFSASDKDPIGHIPAVTYNTPEQQAEIVNQVVLRLLNSLSGFSRSSLAPIEWAVNEITDNVLNHADSQSGGVVQLTTTQKGIVEFIVCDTGKSIPRTLRDAHRTITSDAEALDRAIREGVTRSTVTNMGNGLFGTFRLAQISRGYFNIYSGHGSLSYQGQKDDKAFHAASQNIPYSGSAVVCGIATNDPNLLTEALAFKGKTYSPAYSYVDKLVDEGDVTLMVKGECRSFGSRELAKPLRTKIENLLASGANAIILNMSEIPLVSSSFADEVFGKLFAQMGPMAFMRKIRIVAADPLVEQLVDRAIAQRFALFANGPT